MSMPPSGDPGSGTTSAPQGEPVWPAPPPGYQYPPPPYGYYPPPQRTNTMAIVALVMLFVFAPLAIIFGFIAQNQIKQTGEDGEGFAKAGIIGGALLTVLYVFMVILMLVMFWRFFDVIDEVNRNPPPTT